MGVGLLKMQIPEPYLSLEYVSLGIWASVWRTCRQTLGTDAQCERQGEAGTRAALDKCGQSQMEEETRENVGRTRFLTYSLCACLGATD